MPINPFIFFKDLYNHKKIIIYFVRRDFKSKYIGSYLGLTWAFIQPLIMILTYWFVFQIGLRASLNNGYPYILWLTTGIIPWFFFAESISSATHAVVQHGYIVKKLFFKFSILPLVKIFSTLIIHLFLIIIISMLTISYGYSVSIYYLQLIYYTIASIFLILGMSWITSSVILFVKDIGQIVTVSLQILFWFTPIVWPINRIPNKYNLFLKLNPVFYIVQGYRNSFIYKEWFWKHWVWGLYYWGFTLLILIIGAVVFIRLRPHFADVL